MSIIDRSMLKDRVQGLMEKGGLDREVLLREVRRALPSAEQSTGFSAG